MINYIFIIKKSKIIIRINKIANKQFLLLLIFLLYILNLFYYKKLLSLYSIILIMN